VNYRTRRIARWAISAFMLLIILGGCAPVQPAPAGSTDAAPADSGASGAAEEAGSLIVYSGRSESLVGPLIDRFAEETGIQVDVRYGSTPEIAATLLEEGTNSPADVFFAQDPGGLGAVANAGLLAPLPEEITSRVKEHFRSPDNLWVGVSGRARVVVYNTDALSPETLPDNIEAFTDPEWAGRIGWVPTNASFQAMVTAMRASWGEERTRAWLEGILANDVVVYEGNAAVVEAVANGEIDAGFVNHYYLYRFLAEHGEAFKARNYFLPSGGPESLVMVAGAGRVASGANEANALRFIEYLVSEDAQEYFTTQTNEYPVIDGVAGPEGLTPLDELNAHKIELTELADLQGTQQLLQDVGALP
jgi:iron(III) transport system substrate-binding protein